MTTHIEELEIIDSGYIPPALEDIKILVDMVMIIENPKTGDIFYKFSPMSTALATIRKLHVITINQNVYFYDFKKGIYVPDDGDIESWLLNQIYFLINNNTISQPKQISRLLQEVMTLIKKNKIYTENPFNRYEGIPVNNGVLTLNNNKWQIEPFTPEHKFTWKMTVDWDPSASPSKIIEILKQWQPKSTIIGDYEDKTETILEDWMALVQIPAQTLWQALKHKNIKTSYLLVGSKDAGKSTYMDMLSLLFKNNCSHIDIMEYNSRWTNKALLGNIINIADECDTGELFSPAIAKLKRLTGSTEQQIEEKFRNSYTADIICTHVFAANAPPKIQKSQCKDDAFWDRWVYLNWNEEFPRVKNWFNTNIVPNLPGFLNLVLEMIVDINKNDGILPYKQDFDAVQHMWLNHDDPLYDWIDNNCIFNPNGYVTKDNLWLRIQEDSKLIEGLPKTKSKLGREIIRRYGEIIGNTQRMFNKKRVKIWKGIELK